DKDYCKGQLLICDSREEISPIKSTLNEERSTVNLDDTPVNTAKKNFHELLQEKLEQLGGGDSVNNHHTPSNNRTKPKRPFLKKGEGIARFHMKQQTLKHKPNTVGNSKKNTLVSNASSKVSETRKNNKNFKSKQFKDNVVKQSEISKTQYPKTAISKLTLKNNESCEKLATWAHILHENQAHKEDSDKMKEAEKKSKKDLEELKLFEILEQHAANSSFCSTSSLVARLMEGSLNSTPVKNYQNVHNKVVPSKAREELVSSNTLRATESSIAGYLPFGLDTDAQGDSIQNGEMPTDDAYSDKNLHVRFSETNEYKSVSDGSFSSQDDCNPRLEQSKTFQDDQAWSDCSCASSTSPNTSLNANKDSYSILNDRYPKIEKMVNIDVGVNTENNYAVDLLQKNSLLKTRLDELEAEIEIFRRENARLQKLKKEREEEVAKHRKEKKEFEKNMKVEKERMESMLREEKKKLQKEKLVFEKYCKDLKDQPTKQEREEIQALKQQLSKLKEEINKKDSRLAAANSRTKDRMKTLEQENAELKKEVDKLKNEMNQQKMAKPRTRGTSSSRIIHTVNSHIAKIKPSDLENSIVVHEVVPTKKIPSSVLQQQKVPSQHLTKLKQQNKVNEWGITQTKTFQAIPDLKPQSVDVLDIPEKVMPHGSVMKHGLRHNSVHSEKGNEIISIHPPPSSLVSYTSLEEEDDDGDFEYEKRTDATSQDTHLNNRINNLALYNTLYYSTLAENITGAPENFTKADSLRMSSSNGDISSHSIRNTESCTTITENHDTVDFNEHRDSQYHVPSTEYIGMKNQKSSVAHSLNSNVINFINSLASDEQVDKADPTSCISLSQNSDIVTFTTAHSSRTHLSVPTTNKNCEEHVPTNDEIFIRDLQNQTSPYINSSQKPSSLSMENRVSPSAGISSQYSNLSPRLTSHQNDISSTLSKLGTREKVYSDGRKEIWYPNGNLKKISPDGSVTKVIYYNGDVKETLMDGTVKYFYAETKIWHTTYINGSEFLEFPDGQMEKRQSDGTKEVTYPNATVRTCFPDGREEWVFQDGLRVKVNTKLGEKVLLLPNGQREVHTREHMRREYPDGTVKFLYPDGMQETRYSNGRIRVKDKEGKLVMDSIMQRL
ncbi:hypothetical protein L9F63_009692, partial [Diploptera punctata]